MRLDAPGASDPVELIAACDPGEPTVLRTPSVTAALVELGEAITSTGGRAPAVVRRRSRRRRAVGIALALLSVSASLATAGVFSAHTGRYPTKAEERMGGPGEALNPGAPDFHAVALQAAADIPFPLGYASWREFVVTEQRRPDDGLVSTGALRGWFAASAFCAWVQSWRQADLVGDGAASRRAAEMVAAAPQWSAVTAEDSHPSATAANDPGAELGTLFGWMLPYRDAVLAGDRARVEDLLATGAGDGKCWLSDPQWMAEERAHRSWRDLSPGERAVRYREFLARAGH